MWSRSLAILAGCLLVSWPVQGAATELAGEAFGRLVPADEFAYYYKTAAVLTRTGKTGQRTAEEIRREAWENLVFLQEAKRLGLTVDRSEVLAQINQLLADKQLKYGSQAYQAFVTSTLREDVATFERRVEDLLKINALLKQKADPAVTVTEEEMQQKYLNQHNAFESEYVCFPSRQEAEAFAAAVQKRPALWKETFDQKQAQDGQKGAAWINVMALEALIDLWKIPKDDVYHILAADEGSFVVANNVYGDAVYRLLLKQAASLEQFDDTQRTYYRDLLATVKKQTAAKVYFDELMARAQVRDYEQERTQRQERQQQMATAEQLKSRARITLQTTQGDLELKLWPEVAPKACVNFITLVERGYYDGLTFHRVIKDFMIQGGDPKGNGTGGESMWGKPFEDEVRDDVTFDRPGLLAMANSGPDTNGSQFFITATPTPWLNGKHTIFGEVVSGLDVMHKIEGVPADGANKPLESQKILKTLIQPETK